MRRFGQFWNDNHNKYLAIAKGNLRGDTLSAEIAVDKAFDELVVCVCRTPSSTPEDWERVMKSRLKKRALDLVRRWNRVAPPLSDEAAAKHSNSLAEETHSEEMHSEDRQEKIDLCMEALAMLSDSYKQIITEVILKDRKYHELTTELSATENNLSTRRIRALKALRTALGLPPKISKQ